MMNDKNVDRDKNNMDYRYRLRNDRDSLVEEMIQEGLEKGLFDELKGAGRPLNLTSNPYEEEHKLAHELLKENKMRPAWMSQRTHVFEACQNLRKNIARNWAKYERAYRFAQAESQKGPLRANWNDLCKEWGNEIVKLNKQIDDYNLRRPVLNLELFKLNLERELARIGAKRWL